LTIKIKDGIFILWPHNQLFGVFKKCIAMGFIKGICMDKVDAVGKEGKDAEQVAMNFFGLEVLIPRTINVILHS
jgi:hypothetical protein